jgi:hypothetical protein
MFKTIAETAKELNVTKQCIYKKLSTLKEKLNTHVNVENGVKLISSEGRGIIKNNLDESPFNAMKNVKNEENQENLMSLNEFKQLQDRLNEQYENRIKQLEVTIDYLKQENDNKNKQLDSKDKLLENMQVLLKSQTLLPDESLNTKKKWWPFSKIKG